MDNQQAPSMLKPALIGGLSSGFLAGLPVLSIVNMCTCCSLVALGGFVASYLYSKECSRSGAGFDASRGALVGLFAGLFFALSWTLISTVTAGFSQGMTLQFLESMQASGSLPPEAADQFDQLIDQMSQPQAFSVLQAITTLGMGLVLGAVFSTIGGLIGAATFKVQPAAPGSTDAPPPEPEA